MNNVINCYFLSDCLQQGAYLNEDMNPYDD